MLVGYARVSTTEQKRDRHTDAREKAGGEKRSQETLSVADAVLEAHQTAGCYGEETVACDSGAVAGKALACRPWNAPHGPRAPMSCQQTPDQPLVSLARRLLSLGVTRRGRPFRTPRRG